MAYIEDKYHYEYWEADNGSGKLECDIAIVNDFYLIPKGGLYNDGGDIEPLQYWVVDSNSGCLLSNTYNNYKDCKKWILDNYLNSYRITVRDF